MSRRPLVTALVAGGLLLTMSGCERPTPSVTLVSGTSSTHTESTKYCFDGPDQDCVTSPEAGAVLEVKAGESIGVDVDKVVADSGWFLYDADSKQRSAVQNGHYFSFTPDFQNRPTTGVINLEIRSLDRVAEDAQVTGFWRFQVSATK